MKKFQRGFTWGDSLKYLFIFLAVYAFVRAINGAVLSPTTP